MTNRILVLLAASLATMSPCAKAMTPGDDNDSFDFAVMRTPAWVLTASTKVNWIRYPTGTFPTVASVECRGEGRQFEFNMNGSGEITGLRLRLLGKADEDGERPEITLLGDRIWLYIDGEKWEYANLPSHSNAFSNILYPPAESDIILPVWRGYQALRRENSEPWFNLKLFYDRLITAKRIEWSFKSRDWAVVDQNVAENQLPDNWRDVRYEVDNSGLRSGISWCARQVASEEAYVLPTQLRQQIRSNMDKG